MNELKFIPVPGDDASFSYCAARLRSLLDVNKQGEQRLDGNEVLFPGTGITYRYLASTKLLWDHNLLDHSDHYHKALDLNYFEKAHIFLLDKILHLLLHLLVSKAVRSLKSNIDETRCMEMKILNLKKVNYR